MPNNNINSNPTIINIQLPDGSPEINPPVPDNSPQTQQKPSPKVEEYKKMIQHIMGKILKRKRPTTSVLYLKTVEQFENDDTIDLLIKLRSALMVCQSVGLTSQVLMQRTRTPNATPISSKVNSPLPSPLVTSPSRSPENLGSILPSNIQPRNDKRSEFEKILSVLSDLISNDSRYKTANPKPSAPPFTMQSVLIDIGHILIQTQEDISSLYSIGIIYLSAFEAFSSGPMLGKLLSLYLDFLLPKLIALQKDNTTDTKKPFEKTHLTVHKKQNTPTINIQSPENSNQLKLSHLTIDTQVQESNVSPSYTTNQQPVDTYYIYALFSPLLFFIIEYLDPYLLKTEKNRLEYTLTQQVDSIHSFHRALGFIVHHKPDTYLDLLDIISHSNQSVKYRACQVLFSYYSTSVGHTLITQTIGLLSTEKEIEVLDRYRRNEPTEYIDEDESHIWYSHVFETEGICKECLEKIHGYGLCCYQCKASVHYHCSHAIIKEQVLLYYLKHGGIRKVVTPHFCPLRIEPRFQGNADVKSDAVHIPWKEHAFYLVNLYTLTNCSCCHLPLLGISQQCYHCTQCHRFLHPHCLSEIMDGKNELIEECMASQLLVEDELRIPYSTLSDNLSEFYKDAIPHHAQDLTDSSFEEVSTMLNMLILQDNIINCGVASGAIIISDGQDVKSTHQFDTGSCHILSDAIKLCLAFLGQHRTSSGFPIDFDTQFKFVMSQEKYLTHLGAIMKSLTTTIFDQVTPGVDNRRSFGDSRGFLQVNPPSSPAMWEEDLEQQHKPHEQIERSVLVSWMMTNMRFKSRKVTEILLQHMRNLGLFERLDGSPVVFDTLAVHNDTLVECVFPIPFGLHMSYTVDSTLNAIETCLRDVDLSVNECGFLLLVRRCGPDPLLKPYARKRLILALLQWTFDEDERLLSLHAELTNSKKDIINQTKWAQTAYARKLKGQTKNRQSTMFHMTGVSSGASSIYVATRSALKDQYITRWMTEIHDMDSEAYSEMLYDAIEEILDNKNEACVIPNWNENFDKKKYIVKKYEQFVACILKLKNYELVFTVLDSLVQKWFDHAYDEFDQFGILQDKEPAEIKQLVKLCSTKLSASQDKIGSAIDILLTQLRYRTKENTERGMRWLELVIHSGTGVPSKVLIQMVKLMTLAHPSLADVAKFVRIVWFQLVNVLNISVTHGDIIEMMGHLHESTLNNINKYTDSYDAHDYVKYSVAITAYSYGCTLDQISELDLVPSITHRQTHLGANKRATLRSNNADMIETDGNIPILRCMLLHLNHKQLNEYTVKLFYALSQWGTINKDTFLSRCIPQLIPTVWDNLVPSFDYLSNINLDLLMKIIQVDHRKFQSHVQQIFKNESWEIRYQGLDNLYGFFSKMDAKFQTVWLKLLCHLGPIFGYFIESLWDKEEYVRSKAFALVRAFNTLHLRSAFRCLEAFFLTADKEQRAPLVRQIIELNSLFPEWQVIQWDSLLEALEAGTYVDIVEDLHPLGYNALKDQPPRTAEEQNIQLHMITLAMQMLSNNISITHDQICRLKFIFVQQMGFQDCHYFNEGGNIVVEFGSLVYDPDCVSSVASMMACTRGLKKVMDSFAPLPAEAVAAMASQSVEHKLHLSENTSPGIYFIDVAFKMMNSGLDISCLGHMVLRSWLETYLIVIYKHNILEAKYEREIVSSMKSVIELLTCNISEENKLLALEILKCLLRRSDHLTAMVLSKQILALSELLTQHGARHTDPVLLKAKQFLKSAFLRFAVAGLFVLLFKNQSSTDNQMDLFFVLRVVIDPEDTIYDEDIHGDPIYLHDQPVRDVLEKLMKQQMDRKAFSNVLYNTNKYVQTVHSHPYSLSVLYELSNFLNQLIKHTADWRRSDWDVNPVLEMSARLLKDHPYQYPSLLSPMQALFKHCLYHGLVFPKTAALLMSSYASVSAIMTTTTSNAFADIVVEEVKNYLTSQSPNKETMQMLLELIFWDVKPIGQTWYAEIEGQVRPSYFERKIEPLLSHLVHFLKMSSTSQQFTKKDFKVYTIVSHLVVYQCSKDIDQVSHVLGQLKLEETPECLRFLNWFVLVLLSEGMDVLLLKMLDYETVVTDLLVQTLSNLKIDFKRPDPDFIYSQSNEILSLCFILLRAWALLKTRCKSVGDLQDMNQSAFWFAVWPSIRKTMEMIEPVSLFTKECVGVPIWDMFLSFLQFFFVARSEAIMVNAYEFSILLQDLLEKVEEVENQDFVKQEQEAEQVVLIANFKRRVIRVQKMFEVPPLELDTSTLINQLLLELRDIMRFETESIHLHISQRSLTNTHT